MRYTATALAVAAIVLGGCTGPVVNVGQVSLIGSNGGRAAQSSNVSAKPKIKHATAKGYSPSQIAAMDRLVKKTGDDNAR